MMTETPREPLEGLHIVGFDEDTKTVTIEIDERILMNPNSKIPLQQRGQEIVAKDDAIIKAVFVPRPKTT